MLFGVRGFSGLAPALDARLLESNQATVATNTRLDNGLLRAWREPSIPTQFPGPTAYKTIYRWGQNQSVTVDNQYWLYFTRDVSISRGPTDDALLERTYWTDFQPGLNDTEATAFPKYTYWNLVETWDNANDWYRLGVPAPADGATVALIGLRPPLDEEEIFQVVEISGISRINTTDARVTFAEPLTNFNTSKAAKVSVAGVTPAAYNGTFDILAWEGTPPTAVTYKAVTLTTGHTTETLDVTAISAVPGQTYFELTVSTHEFDTTKTAKASISGANIAACNGTFAGCTWVGGKLRVSPVTSQTLHFEQNPALPTPDCYIGRDDNDVTGLSAILTLVNNTTFDTTKQVSVQISSLDKPSWLNGTFTGTFIDSKTIRIKLTSVWPADLYYDYNNGGAQVSFPGPGAPPSNYQRIWDADGVIEYDITGSINFTLPSTPTLSGITEVIVEGDTTTALPETPAPTGATSVTLYGTGTPEDERTVEARDYVYTYVTPFGEEGPPSPPLAAPIEVVAGQPVTLTGFSAPPNPGLNSWNLVPGTKSVGSAGEFPKIRVYRTANSGTNATFLFVAEFDIPLGGPTSYQFLDDKDAEALGETLATEYYDPPPWDMLGFCVMANGICAGFRDNEVFFSEPYLPYAWPREYSLKLDYKIVNIKPIGASLVVGTTGNPYVITGVDPSNMTISKLELQQACVSSRSMVAMDNGVVYASPDGLVAVDGGGAQLVTAGLMHRDQWQAYNPQNLYSVRAEQRYFGFYPNQSGGTDAIVLDFSGTAATLWNFDSSTLALPTPLYCSAAYNDLQRDSMFMVCATSFKLYKWNGGTAYMPYTWRSKLFESPYPINLGCLQVVFDPVTGGSSVSVDVAAYDTLDGAAVSSFNVPVYTHEFYRTLSGFNARYWQYTLSGRTSISFAGIASIASELKRA